ncbi:unnamed protein product [Rotaria sp. Silwood2]|nr:unnamed protein product [Rotaria sp. Silwood2]
MASNDEVERQAICRQGFIGSLYDIRTDKLEGTNLFKKKLPEEFINVRDNPHTDYELLFHNSQKETFNKMNIEASLKLSLLGGMINITGSAKYLKQTKEDSRTIRVTYVYKVKTKTERLLISMGGLSEYFSEDGLENPNATHMVTGIMWGANVAATFEQVVDNHDQVETVEGSLSVVLKALPISGNAKLDLENKENSKHENLKISFSGDLLIDECPQNIAEVLSVFKKVPSLIKSLNDGKGQQLVFFLYPLKRIAQIFKHELQITRMINEVSQLVVMRIENIFEDISKGKRKFNDFLNEIKPWEDYISRDWQNEIREKQVELIAVELKTQRELSTLLKNIRSGQEEESVMERLLDNFDRENPCSSRSIEKFLKDKRNIILKIGTLKGFDREKHLLKEIFSLTDKLLEPELYEKDVYLLHISDKWQTKDKLNWLKQLRCFKHLISCETESNDTTSNSAFIVIDYDLHHSDLENDEHRAEKCCIYYAKRGAIKCRDYYEDSLKKLSRNQISSILKENSSLSQNEIVNWHKAFMNEHPTGELTEDDFVSELTKFNENGNARNYADYIFPAIDKDRSGTISFCEFMSTVALTSKGNADNAEKRLGLIFHIIDSSSKSGADFQELVKFIEAVTTLVKGEDAVNTSDIKGIVKQMFQICKKDADDGSLSKEEFINWYELCLEFTRIFSFFL